MCNRKGYKAPFRRPGHICCGQVYSIPKSRLLSEIQLPLLETCYTLTVITYTSFVQVHMYSTQLLVSMFGQPPIFQIFLPLFAVSKEMDNLNFCLLW